MSQTDYSNTSVNGVSFNDVSLATVTAGVVAAVLFLLISSYVSNDANWTSANDRVWKATGLTGNALKMRATVLEPLRAGNAKNIKAELQNEEAAHFSDALYSADFMSYFAEPT